MKNKFFAYIAMAMGILFVGFAGNSIAQSVSSIHSFYRAIGKRKLAVAMLYRKDRTLKKENSSLYNKLRDAESMFKTVKSFRTYKDADVLFLNANVAEKKLIDLPDEFGITIGDEPVYMIFVDGKPLNTAKHESGFLTVEQLRTFIDTNLSSQIEDYLDDKAERRRQDRSRVTVGFGYPWYGYYPYHGGWWGYPGWGYGYGGRVGFGVGFGF